eukprot:Hpha_TRINITY_DN19890_c0_g1::TRINITY_DN19890_c0_g1_i1::g.132065::m.132065
MSAGETPLDALDAPEDQIIPQPTDSEDDDSSLVLGVILAVLALLMCCCVLIFILVEGRSRQPLRAEEKQRVMAAVTEAGGKAKPVPQCEISTVLCTGVPTLGGIIMGMKNCTAVEADWRWLGVVLQTFTSGTDSYSTLASPLPRSPLPKCKGGEAICAATAALAVAVMCASPAQFVSVAPSLNVYVGKLQKGLQRGVVAELCRMLAAPMGSRILPVLAEAAYALDPGKEEGPCGLEMLLPRLMLMSKAELEKMFGSRVGGKAQDSAPEFLLRRLQSDGRAVLEGRGDFEQATLLSTLATCGPKGRAVNLVHCELFCGTDCAGCAELASRVAGLCEGRAAAAVPGGLRVDEDGKEEL